jgi:hypothetical protein
LGRVGHFGQVGEKHGHASLLAMPPEIAAGDSFTTLGGFKTRPYNFTHNKEGNRKGLPAHFVTAE